MCSPHGVVFCTISRGGTGLDGAELRSLNNINYTFVQMQVSVTHFGGFH